MRQVFLHKNIFSRSNMFCACKAYLTDFILTGEKQSKRPRPFFFRMQSQQSQMDVFSVQNIHPSGFTLVETLVAIAILLIAVLAPMHIVNQSIKASVGSREQLTATFLAQEGIEVIIRLRDNDVLDTDDDETWDWKNDTGQLGHLIEACVDGTGCDYDFVSDDFVSCDADCLLYFDAEGTDGVYYSHDDSYTATPFTREITVAEVSPQEAKITSTVSWYSAVAGQDVQVQVESRVFDQYAE